MGIKKKEGVGQIRRIWLLKSYYNNIVVPQEYFDMGFEYALTRESRLWTILAFRMQATRAKPGEQAGSQRKGKTFEFEMQKSRPDRCYRLKKGFHRGQYAHARDNDNCRGHAQVPQVLDADPCGNPVASFGAEITPPSFKNGGQMGDKITISRLSKNPCPVEWLPGTRLELVWPCDRGILSPLCLPIPPPRQNRGRLVRKSDEIGNVQILSATTQTLQKSFERL